MKEDEIIFEKIVSEGIKFRLKNNDETTLPRFSRSSIVISKPISRIKIVSFSKSKKTVNVEIDVFENGITNTIIEKNTQVYWIKHFIIQGIKYREGKAINHYRKRNIKLK
jgi:hypothetical protein